MVEVEKVSERDTQLQIERQAKEGYRKQWEAHSDTLRKIDAVVEWQCNPVMHPLTCGNDSSHALLMPYWVSLDEIVLVCPTCGKRQNVPEIVLRGIDGQR